MDRPRRHNLTGDLRVMDEKLRIWLAAGDLDEDDRTALQTVRELFADVIGRPG